jgi:hypothetical protein
MAQEHEATHGPAPGVPVDARTLLLGKIDADRITTQRQIEALRRRQNKLGDLFSNMRNALDDAFEKLAEEAAFLEEWERDSRLSHARLRERLLALEAQEPKS